MGLAKCLIFAFLFFEIAAPVSILSYNTTDCTGPSQSLSTPSDTCYFSGDVGYFQVHCNINSSYQITTFVESSCTTQIGSAIGDANSCVGFSFRYTQSLQVDCSAPDPNLAGSYVLVDTFYSNDCTSGRSTKVLSNQCTQLEIAPYWYINASCVLNGNPPVSGFWAYSGCSPSYAISGEFGACLPFNFYYAKFGCEWICRGDSIAPINGGTGSCTRYSNSSVCYQNCNSGAQLVSGSLTRVCQSNGYFSTTTAICALPCRGDDVAPVNGYAGGCASNLPASTTCAQSCGYGVPINGSLNRVCINGAFSPSNAVCGCGGDNLAPVNGNPGNCSVPGTSCVQSCRSGYSLQSGSLIRTCNYATGSYSMVATCTRTCQGDDQAPLNGAPGTCASGINGTSCIQTCNSGYSLDPYFLTRYCSSSSGVYSSTYPACDRVCDGDGMAPPNGTTGTCALGMNGTSCTQSCKSGYWLANGSLVRYCNANGSFSATDAFCMAPCRGDGGAPKNGRTGDCYSGHYGLTCEQECNEGFELASGNLTRICQTDGVYTPTTAVCEERCFGDELTPVNGAGGSCYVNGTILGRSCEQTCNQGFTLVSGNLTRTCQLNRQLSTPDAICARLCQGDGMVPMNGGPGNCTQAYVGILCAQTCEAGLELIHGSLIRGCLTNGSYTGSNAVCGKQVKSNAAGTQASLFILLLSFFTLVLIQ